MSKNNKQDDFFRYTIEEVEVNGEKAFMFTNGNMQIMTKEKYMEMIKLTSKFYESEGIEEWIEKENNQSRHNLIRYWEQ